MVVNRIGPVSFARISGILYALMGLIIGSLISLFTIVSGAIAPEEPGVAAMLYGTAAVFVLPVVYGLLGYLTSLIGAALYNMVAGWIGGVELDVE